MFEPRSPSTTGTEYTKMLVPYLKDVANSANYRNDAQQVFTRFSEVIRQNIIATLGRT